MIGAWPYFEALNATPVPEDLSRLAITKPKGCKNIKIMYFDSEIFHEYFVIY